MITDTNDRLLTNIPIALPTNTTSAPVVIRLRPRAGQRLRASAGSVTIQARVPAGAGTWVTLDETGIDLSTWADGSVDADIRVVAGATQLSEVVAISVA